MRFSEDKKTALGYYLDVPVTPQATAINYFCLTTSTMAARSSLKTLSLAITN